MVITWCEGSGFDLGSVTGMDYYQSQSSNLARYSLDLGSVLVLNHPRVNLASGQGCAVANPHGCRPFQNSVCHFQVA